MTDAPKKTLTIDLEEPVNVDGTTYETLTFRRRKAKDLSRMDLVKGDNRKHMAMLASMAGVPLQVIEELEGDDYDRVAEETVPLVGKSAMRALEEEREKQRKKAAASTE